MEKHNLIGKRRPIYYEYLELAQYDVKFHLVNVDSEEIYFILPNNYSINYSKSNNSYEPKGHINFYKEKYNYVLEYTYKEYDSFKLHMDRKKDNIIKVFTNYNNREFYEVKKSNVDFIYMYYQGYYYKIHSDHKFSFNEYYDMYFILYSITNKRYNKNINLINELYYFYDNCLEYLFEGKDILNTDLTNFIDNIDIKEDDIYIYTDEDYLKYKEKQNKVELITQNLLANVTNNELGTRLVDSRWDIVGNFNFSNFGIYNKGYIFGYDEIINSDELEDKEKNNLLNKIILQKQYETISYKDKINDIFYNYIVNYLKNNINYEIWNNYHIREFINEEMLDGYNDEISEKNIYELFTKELGFNDNILIKNNILDSVKGEEIVIYPDKFSIKFSALNSLLNFKKLVFNEEYNLVDDIF